MEWLENVLEKISGINMGHSESDIAAVISQWQDGIGELREKWLAALEDAANNKNASEGVLQSSAKTEVKEETRKSRGKRDSAVTEDDGYGEYNKPILIKDIENIHSITEKRGQVSVNNLNHDEIKVLQKWGYKYWTDPNIGIKSPFFRSTFGEWRAHQTKDYVTIAEIPPYVASNEARKEQRGTVTNGDTGWSIRISRQGETNTISHSGGQRLSEYGLAGIRDLIQNAYLFNTELHEHHSNNASVDRIAFDHKLYSLGKDGDGSIGLYRITVEEIYQNEKYPQDMRFHNLKYIEKVADNIGSLTRGNYARGAESTNDVSTTIYSIADLYRFVKQFDNEFSPAPEVNPILLNEDGTPKVFYHGSKSHGIISFEPRHGGIFVTESEKYANLYTRQHGTNSNSGKVYPVYISAQNFLDTRKPEIRELVEKEIKTGDSKQELITPIGLPHAVYAEELSLLAKKHGYDGLILDEIGYEPEDSSYDKLSRISYVVFSSTQVKSATDNIGTFDKNNPDRRRSRSKRDEKSGAAAEAEAKAGEISEKWGLSGKKTEALGRGLTNIFESVSGSEVDMEFVRQQASSLAAKTANGMISPDMPTDIPDKLKFLRSFGAVSLTEEQRNAAATLTGEVITVIA